MLSLPMSQRGKDVARARSDQLFGDDGTQRFGTGRQIRDLALLGKIALAVRAGYERAHPDAIGERLRECAQRYDATARERATDLPLGAHAPLRRVMVEGREHFDQVCTLLETFHADCTLTR